MVKTKRRSKINTTSKKRRTFKKHYMWNTKGKKYLAKTYKQHLKGKKLGHTHTKPKKRSRKTRKGGDERTNLGDKDEKTNLGDIGLFRDDGMGRGLSGKVIGEQFTQHKEVNYIDASGNNITYPSAKECGIYGQGETVTSTDTITKRTGRRKDAWGKWGLKTGDGKLALNEKGHPYLLDASCNPVMKKENERNWRGKIIGHKQVPVVLDSDAKVLVGTSGNIVGRMYQRASKEGRKQIMKDKSSVKDLAKNTVGNVGKAAKRTASIGVDAAATAARSEVLMKKWEYDEAKKQKKKEMKESVFGPGWNKEQGVI